jgi:D-xylose 1-dehydrogenase (NADP+, D-xylono-1,5-lactone-forming)
VDVRGRLGWGVLGTADISRRRFLPALVKASNAYLVAVGSRSLERAAASVAIAGEGRAVGSYVEVLDDPSVDIVYIPLPNALHREWVLASLAAGKHVLCEKPLVQTEAHVHELAAAAQAAGRVVMEGFMYRFHPQYEPSTWQPLLSEIGELQAAHAWTSLCFDRVDEPPEAAALRGGALWEVGCYCLDVLTWQLGEVVEVSASSDRRDSYDLATVAYLRFASGALGTAWWSFTAAWSKRLTLIGEHGALELDQPFRPDGPATARLEIGTDIRAVRLPPDDCFRREIEHLSDVVKQGTPIAVPLSGSARWLRVAEEIRRQATRSSA